MYVYVKSAIWDFVLCALASTALVYTLSSGFFSTQVYQNLTGGLVLAGICSVLTAALFVVSYNKKTLVFGSVGLAVALVVAVVLSVTTSTTASVLEDAPGNYLYPALHIVLTTVLVFLLSRWKASTLVLIVLGVLVCAVIEYLYWYGHVAAFVVFFVASAGLFAYRSYQKTLVSSESEHLAFASVTASGVAVAFVSTVVAVAFATLVLAPLHPPIIVVKLITEHYRAAEVEVKGVGSVDELLNDQQTNDTNDRTAQSSDVEDGNDNKNEQQTEESPGVAGHWALNLPPWTPWALVLAVVAAVTGSILLKRHRRQRAYQAMTARGRGNAVEALYLFFMKRFERFKVPQPETLTLSEYVDGFSDTFNRFEQGQGTPVFAALTDIYNRRVFGGGDVSEQEFELFEQYYRAFYKRASKYTGKLKYCLMYFFI